MGCNSSKAFKTKPSTRAKTQSSRPATNVEKPARPNNQPSWVAPAPAPAPVPTRAPVAVPAPPVKRPEVEVPVQDREPIDLIPNSTTRGATNINSNNIPGRAAPDVTYADGGACGDVRGNLGGGARDSRDSIGGASYSGGSFGGSFGGGGGGGGSFGGRS